MAASDNKDKNYDDSNYGTCVDIIAPVSIGLVYNIQQSVQGLVTKTLRMAHQPSQ